MFLDLQVMGVRMLLLLRYTLVLWPEKKDSYFSEFGKRNSYKLIKKPTMLTLA